MLIISLIKLHGEKRDIMLINRNKGSDEGLDN